MGVEQEALKLVYWIAEKGINGVPPLLASAEDLAEQYLSKIQNKNDIKQRDDVVDELITWQALKNFGTGFITGLGGILTLPIAIPSAMAASWVIQARMSAAIAYIYGHDIQDDKVKTFVVLTLLGDSAKEVIKEIAVKTVTQKISREALNQIGKAVGLRLMAKAGTRGAARFIPIIGGLVGGGFDASACYTVGKFAKKIFREGKLL